MLLINHLSKLLLLGFNIFMLHFTSFIFLLLVLIINPTFLSSASLVNEQQKGWESFLDEVKKDPSILTSKEKFIKAFGRYGNWTGPGLSGGLEDPINIGSKPPVDSLDKASMQHDFAYVIAEKQGDIYGAEEEQRLKSLADKVLLKDLRNLDEDPRKWDQKPKDIQKAIDYKKRMTTAFTLLEQGRKHIAANAEKLSRINKNIDKDGYINAIYIESLIDQKQKLTEDDLKKGVATFIKNWKNRTGFANETKDSDLTKTQEKELYGIYRKNPQGFQKNYTTYKNKHGVKKSKAKIRQDKQISAVAKKYKVYPKDLVKFLKCLCTDAGGSLGGHYDPIKGNPCIADGALFSSPAPLSVRKSHVLYCRNNLDAEQYKKDLKIFEKMRGNDEYVAKQREIYEEKEYQRLLKIIQIENAKAIAEELQEIRKLLQKDKTLVEAATLYTSIKSSVLPHDRAVIGEKLIKQLKDTISHNFVEGKTREAIAKSKLAMGVAEEGSYYKNSLISAIPKLEKWHDTWESLKKNNIPEIYEDLKNGRFKSVREKMRLLDFKSNGIAPWTPYGHASTQAPKLLALQKTIAQKKQEYVYLSSEILAKAKKLLNDREPQSAIDILTDFLNSWEHIGSVQKHNWELTLAKNILKGSIAREKEGDKLNKKGNYPRALQVYKSVLSSRNSATIKRKIDNLYKRHDIAMKYKAAADKTMSDGHFTRNQLLKAIGQYKKSLSYWPDKNLQNQLDRIQEALARDDKKAELNRKIAQIEREKARQKEEQMDSAGLDFGNRFGSRENIRSEIIEERKMRDSYTDNTPETSSQDKMLEKLKENLNKIKSAKKVSVNPVKSEYIPPQTASQPIQDSTKPISQKSNTPLTGILLGTWKGKSSSYTTSGTFKMILQSNQKISFQTYGDDESIFHGTVSTAGDINVKLSNPEGGGLTIIGNITKDSTGKLHGSGTWKIVEDSNKKSIHDDYGTWTGNGSQTQPIRTVTKPKKPASTQSKNNNISATDWDGLYLGYYKDDRDKGCTDAYGKLSIIIKGNTFSGDGLGTIDSKGKLHGKFNNGYEASGRIVFNNLVQGWISGKPYCNAYLELRKDKTGKKTYTPSKKVATPVKKSQIIAATGVNGNKLSIITLSIDSGMSQLIKLHITQASERTATGKKDSARVGEVEFYASGSRVQPSSVTASSNFNRGYSVRQVIDGNRQYKYMTSGAKGWASSEKTRGEDWLTFKFSKPVNVTKVIVTTAPTSPYKLHSFSIKKYN